MKSYHMRNGVVLENFHKFIVFIGSDVSGRDLWVPFSMRMLLYISFAKILTNNPIYGRTVFTADAHLIRDIRKSFRIKSQIEYYVSQLVDKPFFIKQ